MKTIYLFVESCICLSIDKQKYETAKTYRTVLRHLEQFSGNRELQFEEITSDFLLSFRRHLSDDGCCNNTRLLYLRCLQALHRQAAKQGVTSYPDNLYSAVLATETDQTVKRNVSASVFRKIRDTVLLPEQSHLAFARDMFILSFYLRGIPFIDLAYLQKSDIKGDILRYRRKKTGKSLTITLEPCAWEIINRWKNRSTASTYLFPIITRTGSDKEERHQYESGLRLHNLHLKKLTQIAGLPEEIRLTSYTPRHTWANLAHNDGVELPFISEALSHSSEKTTRCYVASFTTDTLAAVNRRVMGIIDRQYEKEIEYAKIRRKNEERNYLEGIPVI